MPNVSPVNQPPRILEDLLTPANRFVTVRNGSDCPNLTFSAPVSDPDVNDSLTYNYYVDPDLFPPFVKQATIPASGQAQRSDVSGVFEGLERPAQATQAARLQPGDSVELPRAPYLHLFVPRGEVTLEGAGPLHEGDAVRFTSSGGQRVTATEPAEILVWEMHAGLAAA